MIVLQRIASKQQIGLLVPAIKGAVYINIHCNYSQPVLTKLYNENIGGHPYAHQYFHCIIRMPTNENIGGHPGELSQWLCHNDSTINIVVLIIIIIIIIIPLHW